MSVRPDGADIHGAAAECDVEGVSAEQVDQSNEDEQEGRLPALPTADQSGFPNTAINTTASGTSEAMPSTTPMKRPEAEGKAKGIEVS